jgi:hypothetical protein
MGGTVIVSGEEHWEVASWAWDLVADAVVESLEKSRSAPDVLREFLSAKSSHSRFADISDVSEAELGQLRGILLALMERHRRPGGMEEKLRETALQRIGELLEMLDSDDRLLGDEA